MACSEEDSLSELRDAAIICVMSDALLRVSECALLDVADGRIENDGTGRLTIRHSKTDQEGEGMMLYLGIPTVKRLSEWLSAADIETGVEGRISGHSLRVGLAQSLAAAGAGVVEMQQAGRWMSPDKPGRYARAQLAERGTVACLRYGGKM